jgi:predicted ATPase
MKIELLRVKNFKAFREFEMRDIPNFCVIVGANGTGKSTIFNIFGFLKDALTHNVSSALIKQGGNKGFQDVRSRDSDGPIEIEIKFRVAPKEPLITYELHIDEENGRPIVKKEVLKYRRLGQQYGQPWRFLDFANGSGTAVTNEVEMVGSEKDLTREVQSLKSPDILAIKGLAQFEKFPAVVALGELIENWYVSDFHISNARKVQEVGYAEHLSKDGDNLSLVVQYLYENHRDKYNLIINALKHRVPGVSRVEAKPTEDGRLLLRFTDGAFSEPFLANHVSDGTIKMLAYLVLLYDPRPHPLLCVEEPENQLYPKLLWELAEEFRGYANKGGQVFVSTHSPDFLNAIKLEEVFWLVKENGYTQIKRASLDEQISAYMKDGDQMGFLWKQGFLEGVDPL